MNRKAVGAQMPVCLTHNDRQAVTQCKTCFKPLCSECVIRRGRQAFCSPRCLENLLHSSGGFGHHLLHQRQARQRRRQMLAVMVIAVAIILLLFVLVVL